MTQTPPKLCPRCHLPYPRGHTDARCPRCGAEGALPVGPVSWLSSLVAALCGFVGATVAGQLLAAWLLGGSLPPVTLRAAALVLALMFAGLLAWLSRHLVPSLLPALFRAALALLAGGVLAAFLSVVLHTEPAPTDDPFSAPDFLLALQAGCSAGVYLLLRAAGW